MSETPTDEAPGEPAPPDGPGAPDPAATDGGRPLEQDEIDAILGIARGGEVRPDRGLLAIVNPGDVTYERLPMLEVVFDRLERILTSSVRNFCSQSVDIGLAAVGAQRFGDYLEGVPLPAMIAVVKAVEWDNYLILAIDQPLIYAIVDVLLGARGTATGRSGSNRPFTSIETALVERVVKLALADLSLAFQPLTPVQFKLERIETNPRFAAIARASNACSVFKLAMHFEDRGGTFEFLLPHATLEPVRMLLLQQFMGEKFGRDPIWENHLAGCVWETALELEAVLEEQTLPLARVMALDVGSVLQLDAGPDAKVTLRCGGVTMLQGRMGRMGDRIAVAIEPPPTVPSEETAHD
jgi:flagellar motor switch protein FliM